jgi:superfamily II DNA or RNA helicase
MEDMREADEKASSRDGLQSLPLDRSYRTGKNDLLEEFYIPCLQRTKRYDRAAGYFDSKSLANAARGISRLIVSGGNMRMVVSPRLTEDDIEALEEGVTSEDEVLQESLHRGLTADQFSDHLKRDRFKCLAWMVKEGFLEICVAFMRQGKDINPFSHYHEKKGIFTDEYGNQVAFSGSINETELAWTDNYESFDVFCSWRDVDEFRVRDKQKDFDDLWEDKDPKIVVKELPEAIEDGLKKHSPETVDGKPALDMFYRDGPGAVDEEEEGRDLWKHQAEAIDWWIDNEYKGIFAMATGTGKTYTALRAVRLQADGRLTLIVVPQLPLLDQWTNETRTVFGDDIDILQCRGETNWREEITRIVNPYRIDNEELIYNTPKQVILTTIQTASGGAFQRYMDFIPSERLQLIADETHNYGAPTYQRLFNIDAGRRIGLSATPDRQWDEEGTRVIRSYFGNNEFGFKTQDAIDNGYLARYEYYPIICELDPGEYEDFVDYTKRIGQVSGQLNDKDVPALDLEEEQETLLRQRAKIKKKANSKPDRFKDFLQSDHLTPAIIFCEDNEQVDAIKCQLRNKDKSFAVYVSDMLDEGQEKAFHKFEKGLIDYLLAINCLDEGLDVPNCTTGVLIASSTNKRQFIQRRGRVLRKAEGKEKAAIYDMITLPGLTAEQCDATARKVIEQELRRAKVLIRSAENSHQVEQKLRTHLEPYGFGHLSYVNEY